MQPERKPLLSDVIIELTDHNIMKTGMYANGTPRDVFTHNKTDRWEQIKYSVKKSYNLAKKTDPADFHNVYYNFCLFLDKNNPDFFYDTLSVLKNLNNGDSVRIKGVRKYSKDNNGVIHENYDLLSLEVIGNGKPQPSGVEFFNAPIVGNYIDEIPF